MKYGINNSINVIILSQFWCYMCTGIKKADVYGHFLQLIQMGQDTINFKKGCQETWKMGKVLYPAKKSLVLKTVTRIKKYFFYHCVFFFQNDLMSILLQFFIKC